MSGFKGVARLLIAAAGVAMVVACLPRREIEDQSRLSLACEVTKCSCIAQEHSAFRKTETRPVQWRRDGSAACPEGFYLARQEVDTRQQFGY
jgi:hypothetical protein